MTQRGEIISEVVFLFPFIYDSTKSSYSTKNNLTATESKYLFNSQVN